MSDLGNEEMSNNYATIPIKKRKYLMVQYSPPPPDEQSLLPNEGVQNCLVDDKSSSICQESSILNADIETGPNEDKKSMLGTNKEIPTNTNVNLVGASQESSVLSAGIGPGPNEDKKSVLGTKKEIPTNTNVNLVGASRESSVLSAGIGPGPNEDKKSVLGTKKEIPTNTNVNLVGASRESSLLSAGIGPGPSEDKKSVLETKREIPTNANVNLVGVNADLLSGKANVPAIHFDSLDTVDREENVLLSRDQKTAGVVEVDLPPNEAPATLTVKKEVVNKVDDSCTPELFRMPETVQMLLGTREPIVSPSMIGLNGSDLKQNLDKSYNTSLGLSINQDKCLEECKSSDVKSQVASPSVQTDRLKWDLNITMDDWECPGADGDAPEPVFSSEAKKADTNCTEPLISSSGVLGDISDAGQQFNGETETICVPSLQPSGQYRSENSLQPGLSTLMIPNSKVKPLASLGKADSCGVPLHSDTAEVLVSAENSSSVGNDAMKSEPYVENIKLDSLGKTCNTMGLPELIDKELLERCSLKAVNFVTAKPDDVIEPSSIKSEPVLDIQGADVIPYMSVEKVVQLQVNDSSISSSGLLTCPVPLKSGVATSQFEVSIPKEVPLGTNTTPETSNMVEHVTENMDFLSHGNEKNEPRADDNMQYSSGPECANSYRSLDLCGDTISEKKVKNVSADMLKEDSTEFDCKAENKNNIVGQTYLSGSHDISKDNKHEDCEHTAAEVLTQNRKEEKIILNVYDGKLSSVFSHDDGNTAGIPYWSDGYVEDQGETSDDHIKECVDFTQQSGQITSSGIYLQEIDQFIDRDSSFQESSTIAESEAIKMAINVTQNRSYDLPRSDVQLGHDKKQLSNEGINGGQENKTNVSQMKDVKLKGINKLEEVDPTLLKPDSSITVNDAATASNSGGNQSRIINLPQGSNLLSPCMPRFVTDRSLVSTRRERYADEDETIFLQRNRIDNYDDGPRRFGRGRFQSQPYRNSRIGQIRGRGRGRGRGFRQRDEWDFDHNSGDIYDDPPNYRIPRHKHASTGGNAQVDDNSYHINQSRGLGMGRGGIRPNRDVLPSFCHPSSRRFSTRVGDVTRTRGIQTVRRYPGNAFSSRCADENEFRHDEKFTRDFPEDHTGPILNSSRPTYQRYDNRFTQGNRNLSNIARRGLPRVRSKSPVRYEGHQNGSWSSPERGSPDGRRLSRRCGSPYVARTSHDFLDVESERMDQPRSANPDLRSPSNRIVPRNNRTLDIVDTRERTDNDEFAGPIHSGRYQDLNADRKGDERRKGGDRCGNSRSFCPPYNADGGNLQFNSDERPRPVRFCTEDGSEFNERGNLRKRDFERRIKNRPGIAQSRMRNLDEEEGNYRENKQVWHDEAFEDTSRMKRRY